MKRILKNAVLLAGLVGAAVAVRNYLAQDAAGGEGEVQISYSDGSMNALKGAEAEEISGIARQLVEAGL